MHQRREDPRLSLAALEERIQLVELELNEFVPAQMLRVEAASE